MDSSEKMSSERIDMPWIQVWKNPAPVANRLKQQISDASDWTDLLHLVPKLASIDEIKSLLLDRIDSLGVDASPNDNGGGKTVVNTVANDNHAKLVSVYYDFSSLDTVLPRDIIIKIIQHLDSSCLRYIPTLSTNFCSIIYNSLFLFKDVE